MLELAPQRNRTQPAELHIKDSADWVVCFQKKSCWQSDQKSNFISDPNLEKYVAKTDEGEIVDLGTYRADESGISISGYPF